MRTHPMSSPYAWIIDQDHLYQDDDPYGPSSCVGVAGPRDANIDYDKHCYDADADGDLRYNDQELYDLSKELLDKNYQHHHQFRM